MGNEPLLEFAKVGHGILHYYDHRFNKIFIHRHDVTDGDN